MKISHEIQTIVNTMRTLTSATIVDVDSSESSMLSESLQLYVLQRFQTVLRPHYQKQFDEMGGTDKVLKDLENYIVDCINKLNEKDPQGEEARTNATSRCEISGEMGKYHTALRCLLDATTINWESVLHEGSNVKFNGLSLREFLAFNWLAARDDKMVLAKNFTTEVKSDEDYKKLVRASKDNFIAVLEEIRRAHNEGILEKALLDNPSCTPGTFGRIALSSIYNELTAISSPAYNRVPRDIENFISSKLDNASDEIKKASFNYINNKLQDLDIDENDTKIYFQFLDSLTTTALFEYLELQGITFAVNNGEALKTEVCKIFNITLRNIKLESSNALPRCLFISHLLNIQLKVLKTEELTKTLTEAVIQYRLNLRQLHNEMRALERLVDNEIIRGQLVPEYAQSSKYSEKLKVFKIRLEAYKDYFIQLKDQLHQVAEQKIENVEKHIKQETLHEVKINEAETKKAIIGNFSANTHLRLNNLEQIISNMVEKFSGNFQHLPDGPTQEKISANNITFEKWALNIVRVALEKEQNGELVKDERELQRLTELMTQHVNKEEHIKILQKINELISNPEIVPFDKQKVIHQFLNTIFMQHNLDLNSEQAQAKLLFITTLKNFIADTVSKYPDVFTDKTFAIAETPLYRNEQESFDQNKYDTWKNHALKILDNDLANNMEKYKRFVILTVFANLKITDLTKSNIETIEWLCDGYFGLDSKFKQILPFPIDEKNDVESRLNFHAGTLSVMLTTLKNVFNLFNAGYICLMSRDLANQKLNQHITQKPYIVRISNSKPNTIVISYIEGLQLKHDYLEGLDTSERKYEIEGKEFKFQSVNSQQLIQKITSNSCMKKPICGLNSIVPLEAVNEPLYINTVRQQYLEGYHRSTDNLHNMSNKLEQEMYIAMGNPSAPKWKPPQFSTTQSQTNSSSSQENRDNNNSSTKIASNDAVVELTATDTKSQKMEEEIQPDKLTEIPISEDDGRSVFYLGSSDKRSNKVEYFPIHNREKENDIYEEKLQAFKLKHKLDISKTEDLKYWDEQVKFGGGIKVRHLGQEYLIPHGIHFMMFTFNAVNLDASEKLKQLSEVESFRNKKGSFLCLPFFKFYRKSATTTVYREAACLEENNDESTPLLRRSIP